jgi:galactitol-specific phosphotransferase system IIB component
MEQGKTNSKRYLIYVACGSAAASANLVKARLTELLQKEKINAEFKTMRVSEVVSSVNAKRPDLVIITAGGFSTQGLPDDLPVLSGLPLMTMVGVSDFIKKVKNALKITEG